eukprot:jgi/Ulvmu1/10717/UM068_0001.1
MLRCSEHRLARTARLAVSRLRVRTPVTVGGHRQQFLISTAGLTSKQQAACCDPRIRCSSRPFPQILSVSSTSADRRSSSSWRNTHVRVTMQGVQCMVASTHKRLSHARAALMASLWVYACTCALWTETVLAAEQQPFFARGGEPRPQAAANATRAAVKFPGSMLTAMPPTAATTLHSELPYDIYDAVVTGVASVDLQDAVEGSWPWTRGAAVGSRRELLHGRRKPHRYSRCPTCTLVGCDSGGKCSGHCKQNRRLFTCRSRSIVAGLCASDPLPDPETLPAGRIRRSDSAVVDVTAPFIGCANITGTADGCPAPGTAGQTADGSRFTVRRTHCNQHLYNIECEDYPFLPFGFCWCFVDIEGAEQEWRACRTTEVDVQGLGVEIGSTGPQPSENAVSVTADGAYTNTTYGDRGIVDPRIYRHAATYLLEGVTVVTGLSYYNRAIVRDESFVAEGPILGDYDYINDYV